MRTILVTGASSGIGQAISTKLLEEEHNTVIGLARRFNELDRDIRRFYPYSIDLAELKTLPEKLQRIANEFREIETLVLCAGEAKFGSLEEFSYRQISSMIDLNFTSHAFVTRAFINNLKQSKTGNVIFIGSEAALQGSQKGSLYCAAKFATRGFAQALRAECARNSLRVTIINPGAVKTPFFDDLNFEPGDDEQNYIRPEDIADMVCFILGLRQETVVEEINCRPLKRVFRVKSRD